MIGSKAEAADDASDLAALAAFRARLTRGEEELIPASVVDRLLGGESRVRVWREYRGLEASDLATMAGVPLTMLLQIEAGKEGMSFSAREAIASALGVAATEVG